MVLFDCVTYTLCMYAQYLLQHWITRHGFINVKMFRGIVHIYINYDSRKLFGSAAMFSKTSIQRKMNSLTVLKSVLIMIMIT